MMKARITKNKRKRSARRESRITKTNSSTSKLMKVQIPTKDMLVIKIVMLCKMPTMTIVCSKGRT
jgi:hypothetical protein